MRTDKLLSLIKEVAREKVNEQLINRGSYMPHKPRYRNKIKRRLIEDDAVPVENKKQKSDAVVVNPEINSFVNNR